MDGEKTKVLQQGSVIKMIGDERLILTVNDFYVNFKL